MAGETLITLIGNLTNDPEMRFTPSGSAVANFTIASTPRTFDRQSNQWKDGEALFMRCSLWREAAENFVESAVKGTRVIVSGHLKSRSYETKEGEKRTVMEMEVQEAGISVSFATAKPVRTQRNNQQGGQQGGQQGNWQGQQGGQQAAYAGQQGGYQQGQQGGGYQQQPGGQQGGQDDPWATPQTAQNPGQWGNGPGQEPPF
ncbi:ssDNA binding protein [Arthrobacter phage Beagle]|nr:ssDNA binding protein [Arthrobacter phage Beagle]